MATSNSTTLSIDDRFKKIQTLLFEMHDAIHPIKGLGEALHPLSCNLEESAKDDIIVALVPLASYAMQKADQICMLIDDYHEEAEQQKKSGVNNER